MKKVKNEDNLKMMTTLKVKQRKCPRALGELPGKTIFLVAGLSFISACSEVPVLICVLEITCCKVHVKERVSVSKICTSWDLHRTIQGPSSHHLRTCIRTSGPASEHPRTCIRTSRPASHHPGICITPSEPASGHPDLHHFTVTSTAS